MIGPLCLLLLHKKLCRTLLRGLFGKFVDNHNIGNIGNAGWRSCRKPQTLLKSPTICNYNQLYQHCLWQCKNVAKTLYADVTSDVIPVKSELCCFLTSSVAKVFTKRLKKWWCQRVSLSCAITVIKFCRGLGKPPAETMKLIRSSETITCNPCSVSVVYKWHEGFRNGRKRRTIRGMVRPTLWKWLWRTSLFDTFSKNVNQTWWLEATEFKF